MINPQKDHRNSHVIAKYPSKARLSLLFEISEVLVKWNTQLKLISFKIKMSFEDCEIVRISDKVNIVRIKENESFTSDFVIAIFCVYFLWFWIVNLPVHFQGSFITGQCNDKKTEYEKLQNFPYHNKFETKCSQLWTLLYVLVKKCSRSI